MRNKLIIITAATILFGGVFHSFAQANVLNAKTPDQIGVKTEAQIEADGNTKPLEYGYVDDRDILWSKTVWEKIDLNERLNLPLYFPIDTVNIGADRRSLFQVLWNGVTKGKIKEVYTDSYFTEKYSLSDIKSSMKKVDTTDAGYDALNAGETISQEYINIRNLTAADIEAFHIKGMWYFDKRQGEMKYRLLGIAPCAPDVNFIDSDDDGQKQLVELFWIFYPSARDELHEWQVFNNRNTALSVSFDHLLNSRRFSAMIYKEDNEYGDRIIDDYVRENSLMQLLESDRIKERIRDFEQDMWNY